MIYIQKRISSLISSRKWKNDFLSQWANDPTYWADRVSVVYRETTVQTAILLMVLSYSSERENTVDPAALLVMSGEDMLDVLWKVPLTKY